MGRGRIRRVGLDSTVNYTLQATETYDQDDPAENPSSWGTAQEIADMDKALKLPVASLTSVTHNGALITFSRFPDFFHGVMVKMRPSYDSPDTPSLEMWTHDSVTDEWTKRRRIDVSNPFTGITSGLPKIFDLRTTLELQNVDQVWITMTDEATLVSRFLAIHLFGRCNVPIEITDICDDDDPEGFDCLPPFEWPSGGGDDPFPPAPAGLPPFPDLCDAAAVAQYRSLLDEVQLPIFDEFLSQIDLTEFCADPDDPPIGPPALPPIDLCDPAAVEAYKAILSPEQLAYFNELLSNMDLPALCDDGDVGDDKPDTDGAEPDCNYNVDKRFPKQPSETCGACPAYVLAAARTARYYDQLPGVGGVAGSDILGDVDILLYVPNSTTRLRATITGFEEDMVVGARVTAHLFGQGMANDFTLVAPPNANNITTCFDTGPNGEQVTHSFSFSLAVPVTDPPLTTHGHFIVDTPPALDPQETYDMLPSAGPIRGTPATTFAAGYVITYSLAVFVPVPDNCFLPSIPNVDIKFSVVP